MKELFYQNSQAEERRRAPANVLWKEKFQSLSLLDVWKNNQNVSFEMEEASFAHSAELLLEFFSFVVTLDQAQFSILYCYVLLHDIVE